ncbi:caspase recruitment domain-containing protein 9 isoform X2 [Anarrhichthys ocellatus]|uniref:caspase recruitment domain-containing protein 9 isoform X2 n=1 Tax=Anarrhichthys ocellatus TaxID=433405 RepID=UPI0012EE6319|nr:caspase recruitment domain-containing protein 9 isoform X2 [Anarrhichthys ocellatus]
MDTVCEDDLCWLQLDDFRMLLIKTIEPSRITPYLRQCQVVNAEDEEQLFNDPTLVIRRRKVGALLDILQRTGVKGYTAFLESLELDYPQLYSRITGKEPNKTFSILIGLFTCLCVHLSVCTPVCLPVSLSADTAGESGLTQFLMSELSRLQRALQDERRRRQQACSVAKEQEVWSRQQQLKDRELRKLTERVQKVREERERLSDEVRQLRDHNYSLMADVNTLGQEKSSALLANRDLQIEVERLKYNVQRAESQSRLLRRRTLRPLQESRSLAPPTETFFHPNRTEQKAENQGEKQEEKQKEKKEEKQKATQEKEGPAPLQLNLLDTVLRLRRQLHRAEEQRARSLEEKEELELLFAQLKGDVRMYRQRNKQTLRQLEEVIRERDKALSSRAEQHEEARLLLQEKDQYREQVRQLTEQSDRLELLLLRSQGEELQLRTRLRRLTSNTHQGEKSVSSEEEEEEPTENPAKGESHVTCYRFKSRHVTWSHVSCDLWDQVALRRCRVGRLGRTRRRQHCSNKTRLWEELQSLNRGPALLHHGTRRQTVSPPGVVLTSFTEGSELSGQRSSVRSTQPVTMTTAAVVTSPTLTEDELPSK